MHFLKLTGSSLLALTLALTGLGAERFRTDINPALRYYQAFTEVPDLSEADHQYLFTSEWRSQHLDPKFGVLVTKYDNMFKFLRQARHAQVNCDWGIDLTEGPDALLPGLARAKAAAQTARLRTMWHLQNGRPTEAHDDLLAVFALGRNVSRDGVLVSALVQIAIENIVLAIVAENFYRFTPQTLKQLVDGFDASPVRGTIAQCIAVEKYSFHDWLLRKVDDLQKENPGKDGKVLEQLRVLFGRVGGNEGNDADFAEKVIKAAGGTSDGVIRLIRELEPFYQQVSVIIVLPYGEFVPQMKTFSAKVQKHSNPLVPKFFMLFEKCRQREFASLVRLELVRAAVAFKLHGEEGLERVNDPCGSGPFAYRRFVFEGLDRGFELKSAYKGRDYDEALIFVEKDGPLFRLDGKNAGQPLPIPAADK